MTPPTIAFASRDDWAAWLEDHHEETEGIWLQIAKKGSGAKSVTQREAVEVALCFGWIDGQAKPVDDSCWLQRFTPRRARSRWSKINRDRATTLIERGEMRPSGLREIERAKADGRWDAAYDSPRTATVPDDLAAALDAQDGARAFFDALDATNRYAILHRIQDAKRPETRARRIAKYAAMCANGERIHG